MNKKFDWDKWHRKALEDSKLENQIFNSIPQSSFEELYDYIAELEAAQRWIPVSERLPEERQNVLALDKTGTAYHWEYSRSLSNIFVSDFTHWMPLPEVPEVKE